MLRISGSGIRTRLELECGESCVFLHRTIAMAIDNDVHTQADIQLPMNIQVLKKLALRLLGVSPEPE